MTTTITIYIKGKSEHACRDSAFYRGIQDMFFDEEIYPGAFKFHIAISHIERVVKWFVEPSINAHVANGTLLWYSINTES